MAYTSHLAFEETDQQFDFIRDTVARDLPGALEPLCEMSMEVTIANRFRQLYFGATIATVLAFGVAHVPVDAQTHPRTRPDR